MKEEQEINVSGINNPGLPSDDSDVSKNNIGENEAVEPENGETTDGVRSANFDQLSRVARQAKTGRQSARDPACDRSRRQLHSGDRNASRLVPRRMSSP